MEVIQIYECLVVKVYLTKKDSYYFHIRKKNVLIKNENKPLYLKIR